MDREKVIKGFELFIKQFELFIKEIPVCTGEGVELDMFREVLAMLKEQKGLMLSLEQSNAVNGFLNAEVERLNGLLKEQEKQKFFVDENGKITPLPVVVRCKDCKHRPKEPNLETYESGFDLEFPEGSKCPCHCSSDEWYSWYPEDDWFCADGERR